MKGEFQKNKGLNLFNWIMILSGIVLVTMFSYFICSAEDVDSILASVFFICFGVLCITLGIVQILLNRNSFLNVDENIVEAKCFPGKKLRCKIADIESASCDNMTLTIILKNGKRYQISGLINTYPLLRYIRSVMRIASETAEWSKDSVSVDVLREELLKDIKQRKQRIIKVLACMVMMFLWIVLVVIFTDSKELSAFSRKDWWIFAVGGLLETATFAIALVLAMKAGREQNHIFEKRTELRKAEVFTTPLPSRNPIAVYTDELYTLRVTVMRFPHSEEVYFYEESIPDGWEDKSELYSSLSELESLLVDVHELHKIEY